VCDSDSSSLYIQVQREPTTTAEPATSACTLWVPRAKCFHGKGFFRRTKFEANEEPSSRHPTIFYTLTGAYIQPIGSIFCVNYKCKCPYMGERKRAFRYSTSTMIANEIGIAYDELCHNADKGGFGFRRFSAFMKLIYSFTGSAIPFVSDHTFASWYYGWASSQVCTNRNGQNSGRSVC
jgi:hypothetical protein